MKCAWATSIFQRCECGEEMKRLCAAWTSLVGFGCNEPPPEPTVLGKAQILEAVEANPLKAAELCGQIAEPGQKEFCIQFALQAMPDTEVDAVRELCQTLEGNSKGECWFQLAEKTVRLEDCEKAAPFVEDCYAHITLRMLYQAKAESWDDIDRIVKENGLDITDPRYGGLAYQYWFRGTAVLKFSDCHQMKHPKICHDALGMLYLQRLKEWDLDPKLDCNNIPEKLAHSDQMVFKGPFDNVFGRRCLGTE